MKTSRFSESQILAILTEGGSGIPVAEVCRKHGITAPTYYQWKSKYAGMSRAALYRESTDRIQRDAPVVTALSDTVERAE